MFSTVSPVPDKKPIDLQGNSIMLESCCLNESGKPGAFVNFNPIIMLAYIDPGSGSLLLSMLIAGAAGVVAFFRHQIAKVFGFFKPKKDDSDTKGESVKK